MQKVDTHPLHNGEDDHNGRDKSGSIMVGLLSGAVNSRRRGYLKIGEANFEDCHTSEDLEWLKPEGIQIPGGVTEILFKESVVSTCLGRPVCISAERF